MITGVSLPDRRRAPLVADLLRQHFARRYYEKSPLVQINSISDKAANIAAAEALIERAVAEE